MPPDVARRTPGGVTRITIDSEPLAVRKALVQLFDSLLLSSLPEDRRHSAEIVLAEVLNNVVEHAYADGRGEIELSLEVSRGRLTCQVADCGAPMPHGELPPAQAELPFPETPPPEGGYGWSMIRTLASDLEYLRNDGVNVLRFRLDTGEGPGPGCSENRDE